MANENKQVNGKAIVILLIGLLSITVEEVIGLLLGIGGIVLFVIYRQEIGQYQTLSKGLAVAGLISSILGVFIQFLDIID